MSLYLLVGLVLVSVVLVVYALMPKTDEQGEAVKRRMIGRRAPSVLKQARRQAKDSVVNKVVKSVAPIAVRQTMTDNAEQMSLLRMKLAMAGFRGEGGPTTFLASKTVLAVLVGLAGAAYAWASGAALPMGAGLTMIAMGAGFLAPNLWLGSAISKRAEMTRRGLPDALDMLVISVEAGLGLDAAFQRVGEEMGQVHPVLAEEFQLVTLETQMGVPRAEALMNFTRRASLDEAKSLVAIVNQAERFGTSIARALRNQADALRTKRRQRAEEKAQKTTVKLMLPLVLFIFPAMLVVLAGPAALTMYDALTETPGLL
ncbi:MAG: type II secretion system F family protein [Phycisphaerae bacterium]